MLPAKSENVAVIRHALAGLAEEIGMDEPGLADLKTVVTEACMNVVLHAYDGEPGPLNVEAEADPDGLTVIVRDEGGGIRPQADTERDSLRLGLSLIAALSSSFSISGGIDHGTEIMMRVPLQGGGADGKDGTAAIKPQTSDRTELVIARPELLAPVLARVVAALAARRDLSIDRVSDTLLVTDAIASAAPRRFSNGRVRLGLDERAGGIDLRLGPMDPGAAAHIREDLEVPDVGGSLEKLADELTVEESDDGEYLVIRFAAAP
ncbi:MAG TPA: ATP-binding protein [Solirubrobacterales bacterium]|nr:ATP-binding protein [Solirubrobacterales bacterium]